MSHDDWRGACIEMKMSNGLFWPIPITLPVDKALADSIHDEEEVALVDGSTGEILAVMDVREKCSIDKKLEAEHVYRTTDPKHPGVEKVLAQGEVNLAGRVMVLSEGNIPPNTPTSISAPPSHGPCSSRRAGRMSRPSKPEIQCTVATSTW